MNEMETTFKPRARLMIQLGDQLIKNEGIALLELVKNAYDAYATNVDVIMNNIDSKNKGVIIISDNGYGMNFDIVKNVWMEPGTEYKKKIFEEDVKNDIRSEFYRVPMGEKGIGRFAVHKLGNKIELVSKSNGYNEVFVQIDWTEFEKDTYLSNIPIKIIERTPQIFKNNSTGTYIKITDLKSDWTRGKLREVYRSISTLNSPFDTLDSFKVNFKTDKSDWLESLPNFEDIKNQSLYEAEITLNGSNITKYYYHFKPWTSLGNIRVRENDSYTNTKMQEEVIIENEKGLKKKSLIPIDLSLYKIGEVRIKLLIFNLDTQLLKLVTSDKATLRKYMAQNGGIGLYRDRIRIENGYDWLELEARRVNNPSKTISSKIVIGAVYLDRRTSTDIVEKTNREGFIENGAYDTLKKAVLFAISKVETDRKIDQNVINECYKMSDKKQPVISNIIELKSKIDKRIKDEKLKSEINTYLNNIEMDYKYISDIYMRSASSGLSLSIVIHEVEKIINELNHAVKVDNTSEHIKVLVSHLGKVTEGYANIIRSKKRTNSDLKELVEQALFDVTYRTMLHKITIINDCSKFNHDSIVNCTENLILSIIINIIDNSIYWMEAAEIIRKKIYFCLSSDLDGYISLIIADNGPGFKLPTDQIVKPFISDKQNGMGIGLFLADEIMKSNNGKIIFPNYYDYDIPKEFQNGAIILLAFKGEQK